MTQLFHLLLYIGSFVVIWLGAGLIIKGIETFSSRLRISSFAVSFFVLGILTSIPEFSVGITAIMDHDPEIFVGNLLGATIVIFLFIIPFLAVLGNGIKLTRQLNKRHLLLASLVIISPSFFIADKTITNFDGALMILLYLVLLFIIQKKRGFIDAIEQSVQKPQKDSFFSFFTVIIGIILIFIASGYIVDQTIYFSQILKLSPFTISLLGLALGTNMPEFSIAIRSVLSGKKDIALGDYIGSAAANTLLFGILSIMNPTQVNINGNFIISFFFILMGVALFYIFSRSKNDISRTEGLALLVVYIAFLFIEIIKIRL